MDEEEKKYNSNKSPNIPKKAQYMKLNEEEEDEEVISESEKKDSFNLNNITEDNNSNYSEYV